MRLLKLTVAHFGPIRAAEVAFGPGLNVLYGPNDLGKSTLAEAIRAALLLPVTRAHASSYIPWGTDRTPEVTLEFETGADVRWRIRKEFGARGHSELHKSLVGGNFDLVMRGRGVDGELCKLLRWGIDAPGGKSKSRGLPESYLTHVLLGQQSRVMAVFERTLEEDTLQGEGKQRLEEALEALAEPPEFRDLRARVDAKVAEAFTDAGARRRDRDSPWIRVRDQIEARTRELQELEQEGQHSEHARAEVQRLATRRDERAAGAATAREHWERVQQAHQRTQARQGAEARLQAARVTLEGLRRKIQTVATKEEELVRLAETLCARQAAVAATEAEVGAASEELQRVQARVHDLGESLEQSRQARRQEFERRRQELQTQLESARGRQSAAREAEKWVAQGEERRTQLEKARERVEHTRGGVAVHAHVARLARAQREEGKGREALGIRDKSEAELLRCETRVAEATRLLSEAKAACETREEALRLAGEQLQRVQGEAGADQRTLREQQFATDRATAEAARAAAERLVADATEALALRKRAGDLEGELTRLQTAAVKAAEKASASEAAQRGADGEMERIGLAANYLAWCQAAAEVQEAETLVAAAQELTAQIEVRRGQAAEAEAGIQGLALPSPDQIEELRRLDRDLHAAEARLGVGLTVTLTPRKPFPAQGDLDGSPLAPQELTPGTPVSWQAQRAVHLVLGDLAELEVQGGRPEDQQRAAELRARWAAEARPLLGRAGVTELSGLEPLRRQAEEKHLALAQLRKEIDGLELRRAALGDPVALLAQRKGVLEARLAALGGRAPEDLKQKLSGLTDSKTIESRRTETTVARNRAGKELAEARVEIARHEATLEAVRASATDAIAARDTALGRLGESPEGALTRGQTELCSAEERLTLLAKAVKDLEQEGSLALTQARVEVELAEAARNEARKLRDKRQAERDGAESERAVAAAQAKHLRDQASGLDLPALSAQVATLRQELAELLVSNPTVVPPRIDQAGETLEAALERARSEHAAAEAQVTAIQARLYETLAERDARVGALGGDWRTALTQANASVQEASEALAAVGRELTGLDQGVDPQLSAARAQVDAASTRLSGLQGALKTHTEARTAARTAHDKAEGELGHLRQEAASLDLSAAEGAVAAAEHELQALPPPEPGQPSDTGSLQQAKQSMEDARRQFAEVEREVYGAQVRLQEAGGSVIQERRATAQEALDRVRERERELEEEYAGWRHLQATLDEVGRTQTRHLGQVLVGPITERFRQLTSGRYGRLNLGPELDNPRIETPGAGVQEVSLLSVGTKEQLATLLRLTVASQLGSVVVLDDQLAQSDGRRLEWFREALRRVGESTQVVVLTCRPEAYLLTGELPDQAGTTRDYGGVRSVDLERSVSRLN